MLEEDLVISSNIHDDSTNYIFPSEVLRIKVEDMKGPILVKTLDVQVLLVYKLKTDMHKEIRQSCTKLNVMLIL